MNSYSDELQIYTLNLRNLGNATEPDRERGLVDWGKLFAAQTWEDVKVLAGKNSIFREAGEIMGHAMTQEEDMLRRRQIAILDIETGLYEARSEGIEEGRAEGKAEGKAEDVKALMTNLGFSFEKAVAALNISDAEAAEIRKSIELKGEKRKEKE